MNLTHAIPAPRVRSRFIRGLAPLLLAVAVSNACAAELIIVGQNGANGANGTLPGQAGGNGAAAAAIDRVLAGPDAQNTLTLTGGNGGAGGEGGPAGGFDEWGDPIQPPPGMGGSGGHATGTVFTWSGSQNALARARVVGGDAGPMPMLPLPQGPNSTLVFAPGGNAASTAVAVATGTANVVAQAEAVGGGGSVNLLGFQAGAGGSATARAYGRSDTGNVTVGARAVGGSGSGAAVELANAASGRTSGQLSLSQHAEGGAGNMGNGGGARSTLVLADARASALSVDVAAVGGSASADYRTYAGGDAYGALTLESTRAGAGVTGSVSAVGGAGQNGGLGGNAVATGTLRGTANVTGSARAVAGGAYQADTAASASASLTVAAGGLAKGDVAAYGGNLSYIMGSTNGPATADLTMSGAGAQGRAYAEGNAANSNVNVRTSGALAVDVVSTAQVALAFRNSGGSATANTDVGTTPGGGRAAVNAAAYADGGSVTGTANANVRVVSSGDIVGIARAKGGYPSMCCYDVSGDAYTSAYAETSGKHAVTVSAISVANIGGSTSDVPAFAGSGAATAYGRSGSGVVNAVADARGGYHQGATTANASAVTTDRGGVSNARATAMAVDVAATASAAAIGRNGATVRFAGTAAGTAARSATVYASSQFSQADFALPAAGGDYVMANVMAAPDTTGTLTPPSGAAGIDNVVGAGMHAMANSSAINEYLPVIAPQQTSGEFAFAAEAGQHLQMAFLSGAGSGFDLFELTISNHGVQLFSRAFLTGAEADLFFNGSLLDLGPLTGGMQDLLISSTLNYTGPGGYAFNYLLGLGSGSGIGAGIGNGNGVTAVPEASTWLMMVIGMGGMLVMARRRAGPVARA